MQAIDKKLLRDFKRLWVQAIAIALVLACGVAILLMSFGMYGALSDTRAAYYDRQRFAEVFVQTVRAPRSLLPQIAEIDGVLSLEARATGEAILDFADRTSPGAGRILSYPDAEEPSLNVPLLIAGQRPNPLATNEVLVNAPFAEANGFRPGDRFGATLRGTKHELVITGTVLSPEFIYTIGPGALMPNNQDFGIIWMPERAANAIFDMNGAFNDLSLGLSAGTSTRAVIDELDRLLEPYGGLGAYDRTSHPSDGFLDAELAQLRAMAIILPPIFFVISGFLVSMVMGRIVALERSEIGLLKATGYSNFDICLHYLMLAGLIAMVGVGLGWLAGTFLARGLAQQYAQFFDFPYVIFHVSYWAYAASGLAGLGATGLGATHSALQAARLAPAVAMQPPAPPRFKRSLADRIMAYLQLSQPMVMILRSIIRWPIRSFLTSLGLSLAVASVVASTFIGDALETIVNQAFFQTNRQHAILLFAADVPEIALEDARTLPGVLQAESQQFQPALLRSGHRTKRANIEARRPEADLSRVLDEAGQPISAPAGGILLSERLAAHLDVATGDTIEAEFLSGRRETHTLIVTGLVDIHFGLGAYMDLASLNEMFRQSPQLTTVNITLDENQTDALNAAVADIPNLTGIVKMVENRRSFEQTIEDNVLVLNSVYITIAVLITVGVAYNAARIQLSERARELASLRILGFGRGEVSFILVGELMLIAVLAQPIGWVIGAWIASLMTQAFSSDLYSIPLTLKPSTFARASLIVLSVALASVMIVRRRLDRMDLISVMKTRE